MTLPVVYGGGGGYNAPKSITVTLASGIPIPAEKLTKDGYVFNGWYTEPNGGGTALGAATEVTKTTTVYAYWVEHPQDAVYIIFDKNGGTYEASPQIKFVQEGTSVGEGNMPQDPYREGHTMSRWTTDPGGTGPEFTASTKVDSNMTVYAQWQEKIYTVTFNLGYTPSVPPAAQARAYGSLVVEPLEAETLREGYKITDWFLTVSYFGIEVTRPWIFATDTVTADITLTAQWEFSMPIKTIERLRFFLEETPDGLTEDNPAKLLLELDLGDMTDSSTWQTILKAIHNAKSKGKGKFVDLDLSACTLDTSGQNEFCCQADWKSGQQYIVGLVLPDTAEKIWKGNFFSVLKTVTGNYIDEIGDHVFEDNLLDQVIFPRATIIGEGAFEYADLSFAKLDLGNVNYIAPYAFKDANLSFTKQDWTQITSIEERSFEYADLSSSELDLCNVNTIAPHAFNGANLSFTKQDWTQVTSIEDSAFVWANLSSAELDLSNVLIIEESAFFECSGITNTDFLGTNVSYLGNSSFNGCTDLERANFPNAIDVRDATFSHCQRLQTVDISAVTKIEFHVFEDTRDLTDLICPAVTEIEGGAFQGSSNSSFTITLGNSVPSLIPKEVNESNFSNNPFYEADEVELTLRVPAAKEAEYVAWKTQLEAFDEVKSPVIIETY